MDNKFLTQHLSWLKKFVSIVLEYRVDFAAQNIHRDHHTTDHWSTKTLKLLKMPHPTASLI